MNQREFAGRHEPFWQSFEETLDALRRRGRRAQRDVPGRDTFPQSYRRLCQQLALARDRSYSTQLVDRLNRLALGGHEQLYRARAGSWRHVLHFLAVDFPAQVRAEASLLWLASALLYVPAFAVFVLTLAHPEFGPQLLGADQVHAIEKMYDPASPHFARERGSDSDFAMFGFYIENNVGVGFRTYAGGIVFGLGSVFSLVFNGGFIGAVAGHLHNVGFGAPFYAFVVTHGAFELTAIALSGTAGLRLGAALIAPGRRSRSRALREAAASSVRLIYGVVAMLLLAAFVEAFWSSSVAVPQVAKFGAGAACWALVITYLVRAGRADGA